MNIVMLAAGLSKRMGKINKLLLPYEDSTMVNHCAMTALEYLASLNEKSGLIVVTGYRRQSTEKALNPCKDFIEKTNAPIELIIVNNPLYKDGQFSSTKTGVSQVPDNENFFIALADMPRIKADHYNQIASLLEEHDAVRPFVNSQPGHPVYLSARLKDAILKAPVTSKVSDILKKFDTLEHEMDDTGITYDIDTLEDVNA